MPCYHPITAYRTDDGAITFTERGRIHSTLTLPCGRCKGCRLHRSREWATRCMHEAKLHKHNSFVTLTYADDYLPHRYQLGWTPNGQPTYSGTLHKVDIQKFLKRLRKALSRKGGNPSYLQQTTIADNAVMGLRPIPQLRYYYAGEYGEQQGRPHYHLCLFGIDFADKKYWRTTPAGSKLYRSTELERLWPLGYSTTGALTFESAAYTARYVMKKLNGEKAKTGYERLDLETGEIIKIIPEYNDMSRRQAIGKRWLEKYHTDAYPHGKILVRGKEINTPRYYDKLFKKTDPDAYEILQYERHKGIRWEDQTDDRLHVREQVEAAKIKQLKRHI